MYKVVIIDDELRIRRGLSNCIPWNNMGFIVKGTAENGVQAMELIRSVQPDLVITDIRMPDMDGLDLIALLKKENIKPLFIIISGYADFEYARKALKYGVSDYILKPIEEKKLQESVLNCLEILENTFLSKEKKQCLEEERSQKNMIIQKTLDIIENEYMNNLTLSNIAERVGVHPNYLSTLFTKQVGKSFGSYLTDIRMKIARELLDVTSMKVYEIAERVGYSDYRWFSKIFKQVYGVTPMEYRVGTYK